jgi:hypothetical protein
MNQQQKKKTYKQTNKQNKNGKIIDKQIREIKKEGY